MGFVTVAPNPTPNDRLVLSWPAVPTVNENQTFDNQSFSQFNYMGMNAGRLTKLNNGNLQIVFADAFAGSGGSSNMRMHGGLPCLGYRSFNPTGVKAYRTGQGAGATIAPFASSFGVDRLGEVPEIMRVARFKFLMARGTGVWDSAGGIAMVPFNGSNMSGSRWYDRPAGADQPGGIAILGDGAGNMFVNTYTKGSAAPGNVRSSTQVPAGVFGSQVDWNSVEFEFINSGPGRDATCAVFVNGTQIVQYPFSTGATDLEAAPFDGAAANVTFIPLLVGGTLSLAQDFYYGPMEFTYGKFRRDGSSVG